MRIQIAGFDYMKSCDLAMKCNVVPLEKPDENLVKVFDSIARQCLDKVSFGEDDMELVGLYLYRAADQQDLYDRCSYGLTSMNKAQTQIIIGLAVELFERTTPEFYRIVFLHELGHGYKPAIEADGMKHGELFTMRLNGIMQDFYTSEAYQPLREDSADSNIKRKVWRM